MEGVELCFPHHLSIGFLQDHCLRDEVFRSYFCHQIHEYAVSTVASRSGVNLCYITATCEPIITPPAAGGLVHHIRHGTTCHLVRELVLLARMEGPDAGCLRVLQCCQRRLSILEPVRILERACLPARGPRPAYAPRPEKRTSARDALPAPSPPPASSRA